MFRYLLLTVAGFISGSVMYSYLIPKHFCGIDTVEEGSDHNPGATNAILCAGKKVGITCLLLDIVKGFLPVFIAKLFLDPGNLLFAFVIIAPVAGHAFSPLLKFNGGKAIAVTCGSLAALLPQSLSIVWLLGFMTVFSLVVVIKPDALRMIVSMICLIGCNVLLEPMLSVKIGVSVASVIVIYKHMRNYGDEKKHVRMFFMKK